MDVSFFPRSGLFFLAAQKIQTCPPQIGEPWSRRSFSAETVNPETCAAARYKNRAGDGCSSGQWVLQKINGADYMEMLGSFYSPLPAFLGAG